MTTTRTATSLMHYNQLALATARLQQGGKWELDISGFAAAPMHLTGPLQTQEDLPFLKTFFNLHPSASNNFNHYSVNFRRVYRNNII